MTIARIVRRIEAIQCGIARLMTLWADYRTPPLTQTEWADIYNRFPKMGKHYNRGIFTAGEIARAYRAEIAFETLASS